MSEENNTLKGSILCNEANCTWDSKSQERASNI